MAEAKLVENKKPSYKLSRKYNDFCSTMLLQE